MNKTVRETKCTRCSHREVCVNKEKYLRIVDEANSTIFYMPGGGFSLSDFPWLNVEFECMNFYPDLLTKEMVLPKDCVFRSDEPGVF